MKHSAHKWLYNFINTVVQDWEELMKILKKCRNSTLFFNNAIGHVKNRIKSVKCKHKGSTFPTLRFYLTRKCMKTTIDKNIQPTRMANRTICHHILVLPVQTEMIRHTLNTKPTIVVPVFRNDGGFRPLPASISFLRHKSKLNPPFGGTSIATLLIP